MSAPRAHDDGRTSPRSSRSRFGYAVTALLIVIAVCIAFGTVSWLLAAVPPSLREVTSRRVITLTAAGGHDLFRRGQLKLAPVAAQDMPANVANAVLSIEDRHFYEHGGFDFLSMLRALRQNTEAGSPVPARSPSSSPRSSFSVQNELLVARCRRPRSHSGSSII